MWQRGVLARMVIKNDKVRLGLWKLRFQDGLSPKECVDRLTDAKVSCKTQIYETLREFDGAVSWQRAGASATSGCAQADSLRGSSNVLKCSSTRIQIGSTGNCKR